MLYVFSGAGSTSGPFRFPDTAVPRVDGAGMLFIEDDEGETLGAFPPQNWTAAVVGDQHLFTGLNVGQHDTD